jgi:hypothetical protein
MKGTHHDVRLNEGRETPQEGYWEVLPVAYGADRRRLVRSTPSM